MDKCSECKHLTYYNDNSVDIPICKLGKDIEEARMFVKKETCRHRPRKTSLTKTAKKATKGFEQLTKATKTLRETINKEWEKVDFKITEEIKEAPTLCFDATAFVEQMRKAIKSSYAFERLTLMEFRNKRYHVKQYYKMRHKRFKRKG